MNEWLVCFEVTADAAATPGLHLILRGSSSQESFPHFPTFSHSQFYLVKLILFLYSIDIEWAEKIGFQIVC